MSSWNAEMSEAANVASLNGFSAPASAGEPIDAGVPSDIGEPAIELDTDAEIKRLAGLSAIEYERARNAAAKALGFRTSVLDEEVAKARSPEATTASDAIETIEPWPFPVDGSALAEELRARLAAYVVFSNAMDADALAVWILGTYLMSTWRLFPKVLISSPTKRCGKSTLLETISALAFRAMACSNITAATLFRAIEKWSPCLLIDEADRFLRDKDEINGIINAGHTRSAAFVLRCVEINGEQDVRRFSVWCPQVFATIGSQADTLVDRSLVVGLRRKLPDETVERLPFDLHDRMIKLRRQAARWADDNAIRIGAMETEPPACGNDRMRDNYTPLWRIALALGHPWPQRLAAAYAAHAGSSDDADEPAGVMLLRDIYSQFGAEQRLKSAVLVAELIGMEDRPWAEWKNGRPLTAQSIARLLKPFGVSPRNAKHGEQVCKAYFRADIEAAFERYARKPGDKPLPRYHVENDRSKSESKPLPGCGR